MHWQRAGSALATHWQRTGNALATRKAELARRKPGEPQKGRGPEVPELGNKRRQVIILRALVLVFLDVDVLFLAQQLSGMPRNVLVEEALHVGLAANATSFQQRGAREPLRGVTLGDCRNHRPPGNGSVVVPTFFDMSVEPGRVGICDSIYLNGGARVLWVSPSRAILEQVRNFASTA
jgi:hypothetical protein